MPFEAGRDLLRGGFLVPDDCSSDDEDGTEAAGSVARVRNWRPLLGTLCAICSIMLAGLPSILHVLKE